VVSNTNPPPPPPPPHKQSAKCATATTLAAMTCTPAAKPATTYAALETRLHASTRARGKHCRPKCNSLPCCRLKLHCSHATRLQLVTASRIPAEMTAGGAAQCARTAQRLRAAERPELGTGSTGSDGTALNPDTEPRTGSADEQAVARGARGRLGVHAQRGAVAGRGRRRRRRALRRGRQRRSRARHRRGPRRLHLRSRACCSGTVLSVRCQHALRYGRSDGRQRLSRARLRTSCS